VRLSLRLSSCVYRFSALLANFLLFLSLCLFIFILLFLRVLESRVVRSREDRRVVREEGEEGEELRMELTEDAGRGKAEERREYCRRGALCVRVRVRVGSC
jgi:hypothetical protein